MNATTITVAVLTTQVDRLELKNALSRRLPQVSLIFDPQLVHGTGVTYAVRLDGTAWRDPAAVRDAARRVIAVLRTASQDGLGVLHIVPLHERGLRLAPRRH